MLEHTRLSRSRHASNRWLLAFLPGLFALVSFAGVAFAAGDGSGISVQGNTLVKDGQPWTPKGFSMIAFVAPEAHMLPAFKGARSSYGPAVLDRAKSFGADVMRFQVSQVGLDAQSPVYDPNYLSQIEAAVKQARDKGLVVIVSMQWQATSGLEGQPNMPSDITRRAWSRLVGSFADHKYVMLELFNEPAKWEDDRSGWPAWKAGMQSLVDLLRHNKAQNVLLLDGLRASHSFQNAPQVNDPLNKLAYAVHPYMAERDRGPADWNRDFGNFAMRHAVLVTEWNATPKLEKCFPDMPEASRALMAYLKERRIGLVLWALDLPKTLFDESGEPLQFKGFQCGTWGSGAAKVSFEYFRSIQ